MDKLSSRQVHLDFHTSEYMPNVGEQFDKEEFKQALKTGNINSITVFAKCHHSWCYFPSNAGMMHPALKFDLTGAMIEAAHEIGVKAPVYITVGWSAKDAIEHPEWRVRDRNGDTVMSSGKVDAPDDEKRPVVSWIFMCPGTDYGKQVFDLTTEVCQRYKKLDGIFYDITTLPRKGCWCASCIEGMNKEGFDPDDDNDAAEYNVLKWKRFQDGCRKIITLYHKDATTFFNSTASEPYRQEWLDADTHFELEDLPTTWGGYDKMPVRAKFFAKSGKDYLGMTGKFHTNWGEFGGFKTPDALRYECASMAAFGARCSVGDQMHPCGRLDMSTYKTIGEAYGYIKSIEQWCYDGEQTSKLGMLLSANHESNEGLGKMLLEKQIDFDVITSTDGIDRYSCVILPDDICLDDKMAEAISRHLEKGRSIVLTGKSGLDENGKRFMLDAGIEYAGESDYEIDYVSARNELAEGIVKSPFLFYEGAYKTRAIDARVLSEIREPYFNRTYGKYCSHQNTPYRLDAASHPGAVKKGNVIYIAHPVCRIYNRYGAQYHRDYFINALMMVYTDPVLEVDMQSAGRVSFFKYPEKNRYVLHLLYASPVQRGKTLVIEDIPPVYDIKVQIDVPEKVKRIYLVPGNEEINFDSISTVNSFVIPRLLCHQIAVIEY